MNKGDILFIYKENIEDAGVYIVYDKNIAIGSSIKGIQLISLHTIPYEYSLSIVRIEEFINWGKKKKLNKLLAGLITKEITLSMKERLYFLKYIYWIYQSVLGISLLENPMPITIKNIIESNKTTNIEIEEQA